MLIFNLSLLLQHQKSGGVRAHKQNEVDASQRNSIHKAKKEKYFTEREIKAQSYSDLCPGASRMNVDKGQAQARPHGC